MSAEQEALTRLGKPTQTRPTETAIIDKWVNTSYAEKAGIVTRLIEEGYELRWTAANKESERIDLDGWEPVLISQPDGKQTRLKIKDHPAIGGYLILPKKRKQ